MATRWTWHIASGWGNPSRWLLKNEVSIFEVRRHWMVLVLASLEVLGYWAIAGMLSYLFEYAGIMQTIAALIFVGSLVRFCFVILDWLLERLVLTERRMVLVSGVLNRKAGNVPLPKITDMTFEKPLVGRMLGYGSFVVESAGQDQALSRVDYLPQGDQLWRQVSTLLYGKRDERELMIEAARERQTGMVRVPEPVPVAVSVGSPSAARPEDDEQFPYAPAPYTGIDPAPEETTSPIPVYKDDAEPSRYADDGTGSNAAYEDAAPIENPVRHRRAPRLFRPSKDHRRQR